MINLLLLENILCSGFDSWLECGPSVWSLHVPAILAWVSSACCGFIQHQNIYIR